MGLFYLLQRGVSKPSQKLEDFYSFTNLSALKKYLLVAPPRSPIKFIIYEIDCEALPDSSTPLDLSAISNIRYALLIDADSIINFATNTHLAWQTHVIAPKETQPNLAGTLRTRAKTLSFLGPVIRDPTSLYDLAKKSDPNLIPQIVITLYNQALENPPAASKILNHNDIRENFTARQIMDILQAHNSVLSQFFSNSVREELKQLILTKNSATHIVDDDEIEKLFSTNFLGATASTSCIPLRK